MPTVAEIAQRLGFEAEGDVSLAIESAAHPSEAGPTDLALAMDPKYVKLIAEGAAAAAMLAPETDWRALGLKAAIFAPRARYAMAGVTTLFAPPLDRLGAPETGAHPSAIVEPGAEIAPDAAVGPFAVIGAGAVIGPRTLVMAHATVGAGATLGADCLIHPGVRIGPRVSIADRVQIHPNAIVGADGFSFVTPEKGSVESARETGAVAVGAENRVWARIHSLGSVAIAEDVEIGAGAFIDRGTVADTRIGAGTKIDNGVQIGHNVQVGENCLLCGQAGVAGSAVLGDRVVLGGQAGVGDHSRLGDDAVIMACSAVSGVVKPRAILGGVPGLPRDEARDIVMQWRRLPRLARDVAALKKRFPSKEGSG